MGVFFIADTHFSEDNIRRYENRPFSETAEMDNFMLVQWNKIVGHKDIVYMLGDFGAERNEAFILDQLKGVKYLIKGNHDTQSNQYYRNAGFYEVYDCPIIIDGFWILSHEPLYINENMPYANIFGHVHNSPVYKTYSKQHYCVSAERINYSPISFSEITDKIKRGNANV